MEITLENLLKAIRESESLEEIKKIAGASDEETKQAIQRLKMMDELWKKADVNGWGYNPKNWPYPYNENYNRINEEQKNYENTYC